MIFKAQMIERILAGEKTVTRRPVKYNGSGKVIPCRYRVHGGPGRTYALQGPPEKGSRARSSTIPGYRLRVTAVGMGELDGVNDREARLEGFIGRVDFMVYWHGLYGHIDFKQKVWRIRFELVREERRGSEAA
jgi:hypothetical protein